MQKPARRYSRSWASAIAARSSYARPASWATGSPELTCKTPGWSTTTQGKCREPVVLSYGRPAVAELPGSALVVALLPEAFAETCFRRPDLGSDLFRLHCKNPHLGPAHQAGLDHPGFERPAEGPVVLQQGAQLDSASNLTRRLKIKQPGKQSPLTFNPA
jgi:hypothetical protein